MNIKKNKKKKVLRLMKDVDVEFVSLVDHGANQTPFKFVKSEQGKDELPMDSIVVKEIHLDNKSFDKDSAHKHVESMGFEDFTLSEGENHFIVKNEKVTDETPIAKERLITYSPGVELIVVKTGEVEEEVQKNQPRPRLDKKEKMKKEDKAKVSKFNWFQAWMSDQENFNEVLKEGDDGLPIGYTDIIDTLTTALRNSYESGNTDNIDSVFAEASKAVKFLYSIYNIFGSDVQKSENSDDNKDERKEKMAGNPEETKKETQTQDETKDTKKEEQQSDNNPETTSEETQKEAQEGSAESSTIEKAIQKALKPFEEKIDAVSKENSNLKKTNEDLEKRLKEFEGETQTQASDTEADSQEEVQKSEADILFEKEQLHKKAEERARIERRKMQCFM